MIALLFLLAALTKIGDAAFFARQIHHYRILPFGLENLVAVTLPWIELLLALAILLRIQPRAGSAVGAGLMALFLVIVASAVVRGLDIECGCFGTADATHVGVAKLLENNGLLRGGGHRLPGAARIAVTENPGPAPQGSCGSLPRQ